MVNGVCDAACSELGEDPVPRITGANCLQRIGSKPISYENYCPPINQALILQRQVKYVEDIIVTRDTEKFRISKE